MKTIQEILNLSTDYLKKKGIVRSRRQAEEILSDVLGVTRLQIYMDFERPLSNDEIDKCRDYLTRLGKKEPLQYIRGQVEFYNCCFSVTPDVLIPRQETELLVDIITKRLKTYDLTEKVLWDVCCGSGCIGIALKKQFPALQVVLSDISPQALTIAKKNAELNEVNVAIIEGNLLQPFNGQADFIVCNPPYVSETDYKNLENEVKDYEPALALIGGETGIEFYQRLAEEINGKLKLDGHLWCEIGTGQGESVRSIFENTGWKNCLVEKDWAGHDRFFSANY